MVSCLKKGHLSNGGRGDLNGFAGSWDYIHLKISTSIFQSPLAPGARGVFPLRFIKPEFPNYRDFLMTNKSPFDPQSSSDDDLGFDDFIGILVAFLTIGTILFWSLSRKESNWNFDNLFSKASTRAKVQSNKDNNLDNLTSLLVPSPEPNNTLKSRQSAVENEKTTKNPILLEKKQVDAVIPPFLVPNSTQKPPDFDKVIAPDQNKNETADRTASNTGDTKPEATTTPTPTTQPTPTQTATTTPTPTPAAKTTPTPNAVAKKLPVIPPVVFSDVPNDFWAKPFLDQLSSGGVIKGIGEDNTYKPEEPVNREGFADILQGAFESKLNKPQKQFVDISEKSNQAAIKEAVRMGFMSGFPGETFKPELKIPREQVLVSLVSGLELKAPASVDQVLSNYKDADKISTWAREKVATAIANNLVVNRPGLDVNSLSPQQNATRAEVAAMIHQALVKKGSLNSIDSKYIIKN